MSEENRYIIISPVRNEEANIEKTIQSMISQTTRPMKWIIVDDGSKDKTPSIIANHVRFNNWIELLRLPDRGYYDLMNGAEIKAFLKGYELVKDLHFKYLSKLDGDISFDENYYGLLLKEFQANEKLGIASGACYRYKGGTLKIERSYKYHVRGAGRLYRRECWEHIGGAIDQLGWDAMDIYKARMLGWDTQSFENIIMIHHVRSATARGIIHRGIREGRLNYVIGYHPLFFWLKFLKRLFQMPYLIWGLAYLFGYLKAQIEGHPRVVENGLLKFIRNEQINRLKKIF